MNQQLTSFTVASGRIDRQQSIIFGCSVITIGPALGHNLQVDATTLEQVAECGNSYVGGVKVRFADVDHTGGAGTIVGSLRNFRVDGEQCRADLHLLKKSPATERVIEMADQMPDAFGLSIVFSGVHETDDEDHRLARCSELYSVDIVASPAANPAGLFTQPVDTATLGESMATTKKNDEQLKELEVQFAQTTDALKKSEEAGKAKDEIITALTGDAAALKAKVTELETALQAKTDEAAKSVESLQAVAVEVEQLKAKLAEAEASAGKKAQDQLAAIGVPPVTTDATAPEPTAAELTAQYQKLSQTNSAQAREFWKKHEAKLSTPQMLQWKKQNGLI